MGQYSEHISSRFLNIGSVLAAVYDAHFQCYIRLKQIIGTAVDGLLNTDIFYITFYFTSANSIDEAQPV